jgi:hypothetical protein
MQHLEFKVGGIIDRVEVGGSPSLRRTLSGAEAEAEGWFRGPPYAVVESVFDENGIKGCSPGTGRRTAVADPQPSRRQPLFIPQRKHPLLQRVPPRLCCVVGELAIDPVLSTSPLGFRQLPVFELANSKFPFGPTHVSCSTHHISPTCRSTYSKFSSDHFS